MNDEVKVADLPALLRGSSQTGFKTSNVPNQLVLTAAKYIEDRMIEDFRQSAPGEPIVWRVKTPYGVGYRFADEAAKELFEGRTQPEQVDLGQFRRPLKVSRTAMEWARNDEAVAECARLLSLIDQQASKGVDRA